MDPMDIVRIPGTGMYTRRVVYDKWVQAGSPSINDAGRLYAEQLAARLAYENGTGSPADDPRYPNSYPLAHVRFAALDIDPTPSRVAALAAAGFVRPYSYEPWHWQLPNIYAYPLVEYIPAGASDGSTPFPAPLIEDDMAYPVIVNGNRFLLAPGFVKHFAELAPSDLTRNIVSSTDTWIDIDTQQFLGQLDSFGIPRDKVDPVAGTVSDVGQNGKFVKGGVWSWARDSYQATADLKATLAKLIISSPPTQPTTPTVPVTPPKA